jgi:CheY-like chemotaxis protein
MEQVIINLCINARDAMPDGGRLTIETANVTLDETYAQKVANVTPGEYVLLTVRDTGVGMDEETQRHLFEPFFTTKEQGKGTGLGLATCHGIVSQNSGYIWFISASGRGTTFKVYLPRAEGIGTPSERPERSAPHGKETILLVEDEDMVRTFAVQALRRQGYTVLTASNGVEALGVAGEHEGRIDLLLTDVVMPQMGGGELAKRFAARYPDVKVLFMSGYTESGGAQASVPVSGIPFLQKPYTPATLARKVRQVLNAGMRDEG